MSVLRWETKDFVRFFFNHRGRIHRLPYLFGSVFIILFYQVFFKVFQSFVPQDSQIFMPVAVTVAAVLIYPNFVLIIKRLHDTNHSGWFCLLFFIPLFNLAIMLYLLLKGPIDHANRY